MKCTPLELEGDRVASSGDWCLKSLRTHSFCRRQLFAVCKMADAASAGAIPVVDFSALSLQHDDTPDYTAEPIKHVANEIYKAFSTVGFVYLKNHGLPQEKVPSFIILIFYEI